MRPSIAYMLIRLRSCRLLVTTAGMGMGVDIRWCSGPSYSATIYIARDIALVLVVGIPTTEWRLAQQVGS